MVQILYGFPFAWCYIDEVIILSKTPHEHVKHLQAVFERLHGGKCVSTMPSASFHDRLAYLGSYDYSMRSWGAATSH